MSELLTLNIIKERCRIIYVLFKYILVRILVFKEEIINI